MSLAVTNSYKESLILVKALSPTERLYLGCYLARCYWEITNEIPATSKNLEGISYEIIIYAAANYECLESLKFVKKPGLVEIAAKALELTRLIFTGRLKRK